MAAAATGRAAQLDAKLAATQRELDRVRALHAAAEALVAEYEGGTSRRYACVRALDLSGLLTCDMHVQMLSARRATSYNSTALSTALQGFFATRYCGANCQAIGHDDLPRHISLQQLLSSLTGDHL